MTNLELGRFGKKGSIDLNSFQAGIKRNQIKDEKLQSIYDAFDNGDGVLDKAEIEKFKQSIFKSAGKNSDILSQREAKKLLKALNLKNLKGNDLLKFLNTMSDLSSTQIPQEIKEQAQETVPEKPTVQQPSVQTPVQEVVEQKTQEEATQIPGQEEVQQPEENISHQYKVNYKDTWYGIVQAKYGITDHKQTMEIVHQLKAQNNVSPKATNMPKEITLPENITLKDGTEVKMADINASADQSHCGYKTTSETGRYTVTQNGKTRYYAADGTELKQSYYEAKEAPADKRKMSENGSGRYSYTAENGETYYFAADGTMLKKEYYERRENEFTAVNSQKNTLKNARAAFRQQQDEDGWAGKTADAVSILWNSDNRAVKVEEDLKAYENHIKELQTAQAKGAKEFNAKFKEIYGVDYNPQNIAAYEANPTDENYKKAYGTKNDIHKRVMDYNKSQQDGAAAVKTTTVAVASAAAAVATGGTSILATAAVAGASTMAARTAVEVTDLATNNIDGDINGESLDNIAKQSMIEGTVAAVTAGTLKGAGNLLGKASKAAPKSAPSSGTPNVPAAPSPKPSTGGGLVKSSPAKPSSGTNTGANAGARTGANGSTRGTSSNSGTSNTGTNAGSRAGTKGSTGGASSNSGTSNTGANAGSRTGAKGSGSPNSDVNMKFKNISDKLSSTGGLNNLSAAEKKEIADIFGITPDRLSKLTKSEFRQLMVKFHPDKNPGNEEFANYMTQILNCLKYV